MRRNVRPRQRDVRVDRGGRRDGIGIRGWRGPGDGTSRDVGGRAREARRRRTARSCVCACAPSLPPGPSCARACIRVHWVLAVRVVFLYVQLPNDSVATIERCGVCTFFSTFSSPSCDYDNVARPDCARCRHDGPPRAPHFPSGERVAPASDEAWDRA